VLAVRDDIHMKPTLKRFGISVESDELAVFGRKASVKGRVKGSR